MSPFPSPQVSQPAGNGIWEWLAIVHSTHGTISAFVTASHSCRVFHELKPAPFTLCGTSGKQQHMEERKQLVHTMKNIFPAPPPSTFSLLTIYSFRLREANVRVGLGLVRKKEQWNIGLWGVECSPPQRERR